MSSRMAKGGEGGRAWDGRGHNGNNRRVYNRIM